MRAGCWPLSIPADMEKTATKARRMFPNMAEILTAGESGNVAISFSEVSAKRAEVDRMLRNEYREAGTLTQLDIDGIGWMFDTTHEKWLNRRALQRAKGRVLLGGLGLGMILWPILGKSEVERVDVLELSLDVIRLVLPSLERHPRFDKLHIIEGDARTFETQARYDYIWLDCVPMYGWSSAIGDIQEGWILRFAPFVKQGCLVDHWGFEENLNFRLEQMYGADIGETFLEGMPIGPPDPAVALMEEEHPRLFKKIVGTPKFNLADYAVEAA